jgi:hypothetical protein
VKEYGEPYELQKVLELWEVERLTIEQAIGQILLLVRKLDRRVRELEERLDAQGARLASEGGESVNAVS